MKDVFRVLIGIQILAIFVAGLCFASGCTLPRHSPSPADRQEINREAAPEEGESILVKTTLTYHILCDLGNGYYFVDISEGGGLFDSCLMRLHRDGLSKFRRRGR